MWLSVSRFQDEELCLIESLARNLCAERTSPRSMRRPCRAPKLDFASRRVALRKLYMKIPRHKTCLVAQLRHFLAGDEENTIG